MADLYIKRKTTFETVAMYEVYDWSYPVETTSDGKSGSVTIPTEEIDYTGYWAYINGTLCYISSVSFDLDGKCSLTLDTPIAAFSREVLWPSDADQTYGGIISTIIQNEFIDCTDEVYAMPYLSVYNYDETAVSDDDNKDTIDVADAMYSALEQGIIFKWILEDGGLVCLIQDADCISHYVPVEDGQTILDSIDVDDDSVAKVTVYLETEDSSDDYKEYVQYDYYLSQDLAITTDAPSNRLNGKWSIVTGSYDDDPEELAQEEFEDNLSSYNITFYSTYEFHVGDQITIELPFGNYTCTLTSVTKSYEYEEQYKYTCGRLPVTLSEKLQNSGYGSTASSVVYSGSSSFSSTSGVTKDYVQSYVANAIAKIGTRSSGGGSSAGGSGGGTAGVTSVNGRTGNVTLTYTDVNAVGSVNGKTGVVTLTNTDVGAPSVSDLNTKQKKITSGHGVPSITGSSGDVYIDLDDTSVGDVMSVNGKTGAVTLTLSDLSGDSTHRIVTDTEKTTWNAKQTKITADEGNPTTLGKTGAVGDVYIDLSDTGGSSTGGVDSVNGKTGSVILTAADVSALSSSTTLADLTDDSAHRTVTDTEKTAWTNKQNTLTQADKQAIADLHTDTVTSVNGSTGDVTVSVPDSLSDLTDDTTHRLVTDTQITEWNAKADTDDIPTALSDLTDDSTHRLVTDTEKTTWNSKQAALTQADKQAIADMHTDAVTSVNGSTGAVTLDIPDALSDLTADSTHRLVTDTEKTAWNNKQSALTTADKQAIADMHTDAVTSVNSQTGAVTIAVPTVLPNPNAITFTGASTGTYDGSSALTINIPGGGSGAGWVAQTIEPTDTSLLWVDTDDETGGGGSGSVDSVNGQTGAVVLDAEDVGALPYTTTIPTALSQLTGDTTHRTVTDAQITSWDASSTETWEIIKTGVTASSGSVAAITIDSDESGNSFSLIKAKLYLDGEEPFNFSAGNTGLRNYPKAYFFNTHPGQTNGTDHYVCPLMSVQTSFKPWRQSSTTITADTTNYPIEFHVELEYYFDRHNHLNIESYSELYECDADGVSYPVYYSAGGVSTFQKTPFHQTVGVDLYSTGLTEFYWPILYNNGYNITYTLMGVRK